MTDKSKTEFPGGVSLSRAEIEDAKREGAIDYVKEGGKGLMAADTGTTSDAEASAEAEAKRVPADINSTFIAPLLDLPIKALVQRLTNDKVPDPIDLDTAKGLLALERAGQNRTEWVKALCGRIGVKSPYEVTSAGPPFTNPTTAVDEL